MKKREKTKKENKNEKSQSRFRSDDSKSMFEMMKQCCEGRSGVPDCCAGMKKMKETMHGKMEACISKMKAEHGDGMIGMCSKNVR